jgi:hypothetical protein
MEKIAERSRLVAKVRNGDVSRKGLCADHAGIQNDKETNRPKKILALSLRL